MDADCASGCCTNPTGTAGNQNGIYPVIPSIEGVENTSLQNMGVTIGVPITNSLQVDNVYQWLDNVSKVVSTHTITFGGSYSYTQLNTKDDRNQLGTIASPDFTNFVVGNLTPNYVYNITALLVGNPNRYWRANESGEYGPSAIVPKLPVLLCAFSASFVSRR